MTNTQRFAMAPTVLNDLFEGTLFHPVRFDLGQADILMKLNIKRGDGAYAVEAEMPGVNNDDIHVAVEGALVTISGEVEEEKNEAKDEKVIRSERYFGKVERSFTLPQDIDESAVKAEYEDGVLKLKLPLREKQQAKLITVQ